MNDNSHNLVLIAMSGGVDSSVAAYLLKQKGYNLIGITMKTWGFDDFPTKESGCCSLEAINNARNISLKLGIPHYTLDYTSAFNEIVINNFIDEYVHGSTPNPCVICNKAIKWGLLLNKAQALGADFIATGHYAGIMYDENTGRYFISAGSDKSKDQSYALWQLSQYELSKTIFPLSNFNKTQTRETASSLGLKSAATPDSQEICFVPENDYRELLQIRMPGFCNNISSGDIVYKEKVIGKHRGYTHYTIGQRRGLNVSLGKPVYVSKIDSDNNVIYVDDESALMNSIFTCQKLNFQKISLPKQRLKADVKIRYKDTPAPAFLEIIDDDTLKISLDSPKKAITPGQSAVFYEGYDLLGGGVIREIIS
jgi:tRNA-specific 2-thiouridylase